MDPQLLMSLLAMRNGGALPTGADGAIDPSTCDPNAMLAQMGQENPTVAAILQMMEARKAAAAAREPVVIEGSVVDVTAAELAEISARSKPRGPRSTYCGHAATLSPPRWAPAACAGART